MRLYDIILVLVSKPWYFLLGERATKFIFHVCVIFHTVLAFSNLITIKCLILSINELIRCSFNDH